MSMIIKQALSLVNRTVSVLTAQTQTHTLTPTRTHQHNPHFLTSPPSPSSLPQNHNNNITQANRRKQNRTPPLCPLTLPRPTSWPHPVCPCVCVRVSLCVGAGCVGCMRACVGACVFAHLFSPLLFTPCSTPFRPPLPPHSSLPSHSLPHPVHVLSL